MIQQQLGRANYRYQETVKSCYNQDSPKGGTDVGVELANKGKKPMTIVKWKTKQKLNRERNKREIEDEQKRRQKREK